MSDLRFANDRSVGAEAVRVEPDDGVFRVLQEDMGATFGVFGCYYRVY